MMERINQQAIEMVEKSQKQVQDELTNFYSGDLVMQKILKKRLRILDYLLRLCKEKQNDK
jgi:hypothetical protein